MQIAVRAPATSRGSGIRGSALKRCDRHRRRQLLVDRDHAPIVVLAALAIACVTGGTPFFAQERVGMHGRRFKMFKLRTMVNGAHAMRQSVMHLNEVDGPVFKIRNDPRLHPLGTLPAADEHRRAAQSHQRVLGEMSLVGPRPRAAERSRALRCVRPAPADRPAGRHLPLADQRPQRRLIRALDGARQPLRRHVDAAGRSADHREDDAGGPPEGRSALGPTCAP